MVNVTLTIDISGCITFLNCTGHSYANTTSGNAVCAAITILCRTAARLLYLDPTITLSGGAEYEGSLSFEIVSKPDYKTDWIKGITDYLILGFSDLKAEYPKEISIQIIKKNNT